MTTTERNSSYIGECHNLSYYTKKIHWPTNTTLVFLPGEHRLNGILYINQLSNIVLKGEIGKKLPVIKCGSAKFAELNIYKCYTATLYNIIIECPLALFTDNFNVVIKNVSARVLSFLYYYKRAPLITILESKFIANKTSCIDISGLKVGRLLIQKTMILNPFGHGLLIDCGDNSSVTLSDVSTSSIKIANFQNSHLFFKGIMKVQNSTNGNLISVSCNNGNHLYFSNVTTSGLELWCEWNNTISMNGISIINSSAGLIIKSKMGLSAIHLSNINITNSNNYGLMVFCNETNEVNISNVAVQGCNQGIGIFLNGFNNNVYLSHVTVANCLGHGIELSCQAQQNLIWLYNVTSIRNYGSGIDTIYSETNYFYFTGLILAHNRQMGLRAQCSPTGAITLTNVSVIDNFPAGIAILRACTIDFFNSSLIANNHSPSNGGGMWISDGSTITSDSAVYFINNTAKGVGGAIYVASVSYTVANLNRPCTIYPDFFPVFENNSGFIVGDNIYNGAFWNCTYYINGISRVSSTSSNAFLDKTNCSVNPLFLHFKAPISTYVTSSPLGVCLCSNASINCDVRSIERVLYPGQSLTLPLITVGVCKGISPSVLITSNISENIRIIPIDSNQETTMQCRNFSYVVEQHNISKDKGQSQLGIRTTAANFNLKNSELFLLFKFLPCPVGFHLASGTCKCDKIIGKENGTSCNIDMMPHPISRTGNNWLSYNDEYGCVVAYSNCPFDYCIMSIVHLNLNESDLQCTNNRSGILCGGCQSGLSLMLGSNKCEFCDNRYISLVVLFALAGLILVAFLLVCNLTVSVGSINGLLFYANMVKLNEAALFPNGISIPVLSQFIAWLNLDFGIQTCFFDGLDGYWKTWLQFAFPLYIWLLIGGIIIGCYYSGRLSRLCGNNSVPVLATLILMSFTKLLDTITNILMVAIIKCEDRHWNVWSLDGNIAYLSHKHIPLFLVAVLFLLIGLVYTGLIFTAQWLQRYSGKCCRKSSRDPVIKLKPFIDAYTGPYKDKHRYWTGLLLIVRILLTTVFSFTTGNISKINNYIIALTSLTIMYLSRDVHRNKVINRLSAFYYFNLGSLALFSALAGNMGYSTHVKTAINSFFVSVALFCFIATVLVHIITKIRAKYHVMRRNNQDSVLESLAKDQNNDEEDTYSPAIVISRREPLIFDFEM